MKKKLNKTVLFATLILLCGIGITSCGQYHGEHRIVKHESVQSTNNDEGYNSAIINKDSLEKATTEIHDKLSLKEHRVYYVDYSWSMVSGANSNVNGSGKTLLTLVKEGLKKSIREIEGNDITIDIIPFLDNALWKDGKPSNIFTITKKASFDSSELKSMDSFIDNIKEVKKPSGGHYNTHHSIVIRDFLDCRIADVKNYHMMILLTDGEDESTKDGLQSGAGILTSEWRNKTNGKYVFGVFVNLMENKEITGELPACFKGQANNGMRRYYKKGLNFDFNVFLLSHEYTIEHRKHNIAYIPIGGAIPEFEPKIQEDQYYRYSLVEQPNVNSTYIQIQVDTLTPANMRPNLHPATLTYKYHWNGSNSNSEYISSGNTIKLSIIDEKTPNVKFWLDGIKADTIPYIIEKLNYCQKWLGLDPEWSDTITLNIRYEKSNDAKYRADLNNIKLNLENIPEYAKVINSDDLYLNKPSGNISVSLCLNPARPDIKDDFVCYLNVGNADNLKAIFVNGLPLDQIQSANKIMTLKINTNKKCHPLLCLLIWLIILLLSLLLLTLAAIFAYRAAQPKFTDRIPVIQFGTEPMAAQRNLNPNDVPFNAHGYLNKYIQYIRLDTSIQRERHETWGVRNWWNFYRALKGDIHIHRLDKNIFVKTIEFRPTRKGINVYVDSHFICAIDQLNDVKTLVEKYDKGGRYKLIAYGLQQPNAQVQNPTPRIN